MTTTTTPTSATPTSATPRAPRAAASVRRRGPRAVGQLIAVVLLTAYAILSAYPFLWMISGAFKDDQEVLRSGALIPTKPTLRTLSDTWSKLDFARYLTNSLIVTLGSILLILLVFPMAAYAFSVLRFPGRRILLAGFGAVLFVPGVTTLLPLVLLTQKLHLLGSWTGLGLAFANGAGPLAILIFKTYYDGIPKELREAALIDGAGEIRIHFGIYLPMARPAVATVAVLNFVAVWNEYVLSSVSLTDPHKYTLPLGLQNLLSTNVVEWNQVMAGSLLLVLPVIIVFVVLQRYFISAVQGAIKG